jgi:hypothetical protein
MAKTTPPLTAQERVILFCTATASAMPLLASPRTQCSCGADIRPGREAGATLRADARGRDGSIREELAGVMGALCRLLLWPELPTSPQRETTSTADHCNPEGVPCL